MNTISGGNGTMNTRDFKQLRADLEQMVSRVRADADAVAEQARGPSGGQAGGGLSNAPMHIGDMGSDEYLHDLNTVLLKNEHFLAGEAIAALERLKDGTFGQCEACGVSIPRERLEALPYTRYCVSCAATASDSAAHLNLNDGRPQTPQDTLADEAEMTRKPRNRPPAKSSARMTPAPPDGEAHATGTAGGGTAAGGLAGTNLGHGSADIRQYGCR
jgi:RNA polymerase-binding transcription factor DksA